MKSRNSICKLFVQIQQVPIEHMLDAAIIFCAVVYGYFFVLSGSHWSLMDEHGDVLRWGGKEIEILFQNIFEMHDDFLKRGLFRPVYITYRILRFSFLIPEPHIFRSLQILLVTFTCIFFFKSLRIYGMSSLQSKLAVFTYLTNLSLKEGIFYSTAPEVPGLFFFSLSFYFFCSRKIIPALFVYVLACGCKEIFVLMSPVFLLGQENDSISRRLFKALLF